MTTAPQRRWSFSTRALAFLLLLALISVSGHLAAADRDAEHAHPHGGDTDTREPVELPARLQAHMLANMRAHVGALHKIIAALASGQEDEAARIAEWQLGLSSLKSHGADKLGKHMPSAMRAFGREMHSAASRFALEAQTAGVTGDLRPALAALAEVTARCAACHAAYRVR